MVPYTVNGGFEIWAYIPKGKIIDLEKELEKRGAKIAFVDEVQLPRDSEGPFGFLDNYGRDIQNYFIRRREKKLNKKGWYHHL